MTPTEIGLIIGQAVTFCGFIFVLVGTVINKKARTPADANESMRIGNEFVNGMLKEAREERKELRATITELRTQNVSQESTIQRLESILEAKDDRINALETVIKTLTRMLQNDERVTLEIVLGLIKATGAISTDMPDQ